ncbi:MAG: sporulation protein YqfD [Clostridia bacterium]|nr:sporulation protein YqfD [Clostridia bacterium]
MVTAIIRGLNLEKLLRESQRAGIRLQQISRMEPRAIRVRISPLDRKEMEALCQRFGWEICPVKEGAIERAVRFCRVRYMLLAGGVLCLMLVAASTQMVLGVRVTGAQEYGGQVSGYLERAGARTGKLKRSLSLDALREGLLLHLPGLSHVSLRFSGSMLEVECHLTREGEQVVKQGTGNHLIASQDGIVTKVAVDSGTPLVKVGDPVYAGQMLVRGEERDRQGGINPVMAQGRVNARVWVQGSAKSGLYKERVQETGRTSRSVAILTPWHSLTLRQAEPFEAQHETVITEKVIDLFVPLWRRTVIYEEIQVKRELRSRTDAASEAQGAAESLAKKQLPAGVLILDKWVEYSMIDNEFVCASVVLEYEQDIAVRSGKE